jgi:uncharacterized membrane protein
VSLYDWLLFLHVLAAFLLVSALVLHSFLIASARNADVPSDFLRNFRLSIIGDALAGIGSIGTLVFGIWLAIQVDAYHVWDGWVIAALVLWAAYGGVGGRASKRYARARDRARALAAEGDAPSGELKALVRDPRALTLHVVSAGFVLLLLLDMIFKPGA